ncbi:MAG TPA: PAS domain-containing protein [Opitutaceae bacterium]
MSAEPRTPEPFCHTPASARAAAPDGANEREPFALAIDTIPGLVWSARPDGHIDFLNRRWLDYTGMALEEACGWGWRAAIHPDDLPALESYWRSVLASGQPGETEARLRRFDGVYRWFLFRGVPLYAASGKLIKWYGQTTDIDDRKRAEEQLQRSEAYLTEAQKLSQTGSFGWNVATGELVWSDETYCLLECDRSTKPTLDLVLSRVHPEGLEFVRQIVTDASRAGADLDFEHRLLLPSGATRHVHVRARAVRNHSGNLEFVGAIMDITARKQASEALRASEHLARGQVAALTSTLAALAREPVPEKFLEHVLRTISSHLGGHSASVWELNEETGRVQLVANCENDRLRLATPAEAQASSGIALTTQPHPIWTEFFRTGAHCVIGQIDADTVRVRNVDAPDSAWYDWSSDTVVNPISQSMARRLHALGIVATLAVPMFDAGRVTGLISVRFARQRSFPVEDVELARALAHQAVLAIQLMRLSRQSRQAAVVEERNRMARDIHDTLAQGFTGVIVQLEAAEDARSRGLTREADEHLSRARALASDSLQEARRSVRALRPRALTGKNLCAALEELVGRMTAGTTLRGECNAQGHAPPLPDEWETNLLRISQEALTNALRHAGARTFSVCLVFEAQGIRLELRDDGSGFDPAAQHEGYGLPGMKERVDAMGGSLMIASGAGRGTTIVVSLPLPEEPGVIRA